MTVDLCQNYLYQLKSDQTYISIDNLYLKMSEMGTIKIILYVSVLCEMIFTLLIRYIYALTYKITYFSTVEINIKLHIFFCNSLN